MSGESTSIVPRKDNGLQPAEDLRRPDKHGQLPHIISTTFPDRPIGELEIEDVLDINWNGVRTAVRDAIVRVEHEGDLSSATLRETIQLIALVLRKLEFDDAELRRRLANHQGIGFFGWLIAATPTRTGGKLRGIIGDRRRARKKLAFLGSERDAIFGLRVDLAVVVDRKIDALLTHESPEYRKLQQGPAQSQAIRATAESILEDLKELDKVERCVERDRIAGYVDGIAGVKRVEQLKRKIPAFIKFASRHAQDEVRDEGDAEVCLRQLIADLEADSTSAARAMEAMRDARKRELYGQAAAAVDAAPPT